MLGFVKDQFVYIKCPKNGCTTYSNFLSARGWQPVNLFENNLDLSSMQLWGHITDPQARHSRGLTQYIYDNKIDIDEPALAMILVSGVFDEHTYSLHMMLGKLMSLNIDWIPLDVEITKWNSYPEPPQVLNGDDLTNQWFCEHGFDYVITAQDRANASDSVRQTIKQKVEQAKITYSDQYQKLVKNFLEPDMLLYDNTIAKFQQKYLHDK